MDEMASFLDVSARKTVNRMANQLLRFFHNKEFELSTVHDRIKSSSDCRKIVSNNYRKMFSNSGFEEKFLDTSWSEG